ncbi:MAG: autotransporter domain-containing protein [Hyphomicrobium sp.]
MNGKQLRATMLGVGPSLSVVSNSQNLRPSHTNYSNDAGRGSDTFADDAGLMWRRALLGGVAAGAMWAGMPRQASASVPLCGSSSTYDFVTHTLTCVQDQSAGITAYVPNLIVKDLTKNITPTSGTVGIFVNTGDVATLNSTFGAHSITTTGNYAHGISVEATNGVTIVHSGDITTSGNTADGINTYAYYGIANVTSTGEIATSGASSHGIEARSAYGGVIVTSTGNFLVQGDGSAGIRAIGHNGSYGSGEAVTVNSAGSIKALGDGGRGIDARNFEGATSVTSVGEIAVGNYGAGILAQGNYGQVSVNSTGDITGGASSSGIVATGGFFGKGGPLLRPLSNGGISVTSVGDITLTGDNNFRGGPLGLSAAGILAFGAGDITIDSTGDISVSGDNRSGIIAASYGGYCCRPVKSVPFSGVSIVSVGDITTTGNSSFGIAGVSLYSDGVTISSVGDIETSGTYSAGIIGGSRYGNIAITSKGDITTTGQQSDGIVAFQDSFSGSAVVTSTGDIKASGQNSSGIVVESGYANTVNILGGTVSGGTSFQGGTAGGVVFDGGFKNTLNNHGTITGGGSGWAVLGSYGGETVNNFGTITGNVDLINLGRGSVLPAKAASPNSGLAPSSDDFNNAAGATFNSGDTVKLGYGTLTNGGTLSPGGDRKVQTTSLFGNLVQSAKGLFSVDVDHTANASDRIDVVEGGGSIVTRAGRSGTATLSGTIAASLLSFDAIKADKNFTILSAAGGVSHAGLRVADTALVDYTLLYPNANDVVLAMNVTFSSAGLTPNQSAVVDYFGRGVGAGAPAELEQAYLALLNAADAASLGAIADQLYSNAGGGAALGAMQSGDALALGMRSCPVAEGPYGQLRETSCIWAKPAVRRFAQGMDTDTANIRDRTAGIAGGFQAAVGANTWAGLGVSLEDSNTEINSTTQMDGTWWQIGGVAKWTSGPWKLSGSISGGQGDIDTERGINIPGVSAVATSGTDVGLVTTLTRLAYSFGASGLYVTPMLDLGVSYINVGGFTEQGAGVLNLVVSSSSDWIVSGGPAVEIGSTITGDGFTYRPYVKAGVTFLSDDGFTSSARFVSAPAGLAPFTITSRFDDIFADLTAGVQIFGGNGLNLRLNYDGRFGENSQQQGLDAKLTVNY